jgi:hypothetical protein
MAKVGGESSRVLLQYVCQLAESVRLSCTGTKLMGSAGKKSSEKDTSTRGQGGRRRSPPGFAVCIDNSHYPASLELHKIYRVVRDDDAFGDGNLRIVDESGEDYLYPSEWFVPIAPPLKVRASIKSVA